MQNISEIHVRTNQCPHVKVAIFDTTLEALLDSGASVSVTNSEEIVERYGLEIFDSPVQICTADRTQYACLGYANIPITFKGITKVVSVIIVPQITRKLILGIDFWKTFGIKPMIEGKFGLEEVTEIKVQQQTTEEEIFHFFIQPIESFPAIKQQAPDETLDIPGLEIPEASKVTPETVEIEHDLNANERAELAEVVRTFSCTTDNRLGRTTLLRHEIHLREDAKPRRQVVYRW